MPKAATVDLREYKTYDGDNTLSIAKPPSVPSVGVLRENSFNPDQWTPEVIAAFPDVDPGLIPAGWLLLCQIALPPKKIGSFFMPDEIRDTVQYRIQTALVRAMGKVAFCKRETGEPWPEGAWVGPGSFIRAPMYGGDRFKITGEDGQDVLFVMIKDLDVIAHLTGDPLAVKSDW